MTPPTIARAAAFCCGLFALALAAPALAATPTLLAHQVPLALDGPGTAWILTSTALVLMMTLPVWRSSTAAWSGRRT